VSVAYAVWSGLGTAAEPLSLMKAAAINMVVVGVVILNLSGSH
jgi:multidrug transporter EmrE-like cation transporter